MIKIYTCTANGKSSEAKEFSSKIDAQNYFNNFLRHMGAGNITEFHCQVIEDFIENPINPPDSTVEDPMEEFVPVNPNNTNTYERA